MTRYLFDRFCLDSDQKLLTRGEEPVRLTPRAFRLLEFLLRQRPNAVSKRDLLQHVWSGDIVEESNLKSLVLEIRAALEERGGRAAVIRTAYGFGYAFAGDAAEEALSQPQALVALRWAAGSIRLPAGLHLIGRGPDCAVIIDAASVSREHANLLVARHELRLTDLGSKNGTFVATTRIDAPTDLFDNCRIRIGEVVVDVLRLGKDTSTVTLDAGGEAGR
ncbi:MAG: FHA domain-containing protein [Acidobacteria bacterium]|nr:FHA domain-containing protein [Acidobacteriota bacterium]MBV9069154.1 FHA domain-containing protein [Acidobacteriota bacterium]MBV9186541.1 FHA domain-containing protein [Acidobacteriota bacterium]